MKTKSTHIPVMANEVLELLQNNIDQNGTLIDGTLGLGGHSKFILEEMKNLHIIGVDQDQKAIEIAKENLQGNNIEYIQNNFVEYSKIAKNFDAVLLDIGVSSMQIDLEERGFSYRFPLSKLDMRMDTTSDISASEILNTYSLEDLTNVFKNFGEERYSYKIAKSVEKYRGKTNIETVQQLLDIVDTSIPKGINHLSTYKRIFQALRIEVNQELKVLQNALNNFLDNININGILIVISYHSLEDKIVKTTFEQYIATDDIIELPYTIGENEKYKLLTGRSAKKPSHHEIENNSRANSARFRAIKRVA